MATAPRLQDVQGPGSCSLYQKKDTGGSRDTHEGHTGHTDTRIAVGQTSDPGGAGTHTGHTGHDRTVPVLSTG